MKKGTTLSAPLTADEVLDATGLYCPLPVVKTAERIKEMPAGQVLELISDDGGIQADLPAWCESFGHEYLGLLRDGVRWRLYVRKKGDS
ncbi:sulfurtransferase TusA family protein [bacterium]|nr:sulfurtransferase TusA family protein [bacterium]